MARRSFAALVPLFAVLSPSLLAEEPHVEWLYMLPPALLSLEPVHEPSTRPPVAFGEPVEAPRPAPPVEIVMTPVGASLFSCSIAPPDISSTPLVAVLHPSPADAQAEPVTILLEPVVAPRPTP